MYTCERCGTRFGRPAAVLESCPRCLAREGVRVNLAFRPLEDGGRGRDDQRLPGGLEAAVRRGQVAARAGSGRSMIGPGRYSVPATEET
jgi:hypothetical protein